MKRILLSLLASLIVISAVPAQTPPTPPTDKKAEPKKPEKAEQEPRPASQEQQKQDSQKKDAPPPSASQPSPNPIAAERAAEKKEDKKWDVNNPPGPQYDVPIDVTEGTWLSLDVSPDGNEIAFDLLGDIYTIPMSGGDAKALTTGIAWDMQPRYSPNGKWIAFTSDRAGGDNIWIMNRDGSKPQQVTKETFRLTNEPYWSPDSEYLVARKHFTAERSLGAGEVWLYHRSGGEGLQLTKKRTEQKDTGEPALSPDGRYLYYSDDTTPGAIYQYNKDPNTQIYVIQRLDRQTGEIEPFVTGPGGSVRPTPSPDGKSLAFIRRVRYKSTLFILDLESGKETPIARGPTAVMRLRSMTTVPSSMTSSPSTAIPADAKVIDVAGKTSMPGIVDVHWHGPMGADEIIPQQSWINYAALAFGVTTLHDPSNNSSEIFTAAEILRAGQLLRPPIFSHGQILYSAKDQIKADLDSLAERSSTLLDRPSAGYEKSHRRGRRSLID